MREILKYSHKKLIKKYNDYYIRFMGGQYSSLPCDIKVTLKEANEIINNPQAIVEIFNVYRGKVQWTINSFIESGLVDYLSNEEYPSEEIKDIIRRLDKCEEIKFEMYESIMIGEFPVSGLVQICGKTAKDITKENDLDIGKSYLLLLELKEKTAMS